MKNYAAIADLKAKATFHIEKVFDRGYNDCKVELTEEEAKAHYNVGYEDGTKARDGERGSIYYGGYGDGLKDGYEKGLKHGQELRAEEVKCAEACGMRRAWKAARKIVLTDEDGGIPNHNIPKIYNTSYYGVMKSIPVQEAIAKLEAWEKKQEQEQEQSKKRCENCDHYCGYDNKFKCDIKGVLCIERDRWTPKQEQNEKNCKNCAHRISEKSNEKFFKCDAKGNCVNHEQWTPKQDAPDGSIKVGDEVRMIGSDPKLDNCDFGVCTMVKPKTIYIMRMDGSVGEEDKEEWEKTGNHYDIQSILDKMKENEVKE